MNLTTQLRIILLLVGAAVWLGIYLLGKRRATPRESSGADEFDEPIPDTTGSFATTEELDEEALETPAYMRRHGQREARQDYEPRIANVDDYADSDEVRDGNRQFVDIAVHSSRREALVDNIDADQPMHSADHAQPLFVEPVYDELPQLEVASPAIEVRREPRVSLDDSFAVPATAEPHLSVDSPQDAEVPVVASVATPVQAANLPAAEAAATTSIPVMAEPITTHHAQPVRPAEQQDTPTLSNVVRKPLQPESAAPTPTTAKPTNNPAARRKIIALRLPMPERVPGSQLLSLLQREQLQHGKFSIFHRMHEAQSVFSVASMVEPGSFEPNAMAEQQFPGVTLFMLLPGPLDGLVAYDQMMSCAQRLAHATGGTLQDERGSKLTAQSMERLRDEVLDFQHLFGGVAATH